MDLQKRIIEIGSKQNINLNNMGFIGDIIDAIIGAISRIVDFIVAIVEGILNFALHVVSYFKNLRLSKEKQTPFVLNAMDPQFKEMLKRAPVKNVGIFEGVYNEQTDQIEHGRYLEADALDSATREVLENEKLVVLN
jgi:hypothetical protein